MYKFLTFLILGISILTIGCNTTAGEEAKFISPEKVADTPTEDTTTYLDLNSGARVRLIINPTNDITTNAETGEIVRIYVNPKTKDTMDGLNGRKVNHAIIRTNLGTFGIDMTKVKLEDKLPSTKKGEVTADRSK